MNKIILEFTVEQTDELMAAVVALLNKTRKFNEKNINRNVHVDSRYMDKVEILNECKNIISKSMKDI